MKKRKGAYLPFNMSYPQRYVLDPNIIGTPDADKAKAACKYDAIDLDMQESETTLTVGAIIWATGWQPYDADKIQPYGHDRFDNVVSSVEFERMLDPSRLPICVRNTRTTSRPASTTSISVPSTALMISTRRYRLTRTSPL
jgi:heterodisulfide reductase subunit A-like polyferredoxin